MKSNSVRNYLYLSLLGAFNGLLFGTVVEILRRIYTPIFSEYYLTRELEEAPDGAKIIPSVTSFIGGYFDIPLLCLVIFLVLTPPILIYLKKHFHASPMCWQVSGIVSATAVVLIHDFLNPFGHNLWLFPLVWRWVFCMAVVSFINLIYGLSLGGWEKFHSSEVYR